MPRDGTGQYTLPMPPVFPGDVIESVWANTTLNDIALALTDSLSRTGAGGLLVPFQVADGTVGAPGLAFANEPSSGLYRAALNQWGLVCGGAERLRIENASVSVMASVLRLTTGDLRLPNNKAIYFQDADGADNNILYADANDNVTLGGAWEGLYLYAENNQKLAILPDSVNVYSGPVGAQVTELTVTDGAVLISGYIGLQNGKPLYSANASGINWEMIWAAPDNRLVVGFHWPQISFNAGATQVMQLVAGNVTIWGGLTQNGAMVVTGNATINGALTQNGTISLPNNTAVNFSGGGLLYAHTNGALVAGATSNFAIAVGAVTPVTISASLASIGIPLALGSTLTVPNNVALHFRNSGGVALTAMYANLSNQLIIGDGFPTVTLAANGAIYFSLTSGLIAAGTPIRIDNASAGYSLSAFGSNADPRGMYSYYSNFGLAQRSPVNQHIVCGDTSGNVMFVSSNGGIYNFSDNNANLSDVNSKVIIAESPDLTDFVERLTFRRFTYIDNPSAGEIDGVTAQDIEQFAPDLVVPWGDSGMKGVLTNRLQARINSVIPRLVQRMKLLNARVKALEDART